jgi:hypothetical protein
MADRNKTQCSKCIATIAVIAIAAIAIVVGALMSTGLVILSLGCQEVVKERYVDYDYSIIDSYASIDKMLGPVARQTRTIANNEPMEGLFVMRCIFETEVDGVGTVTVTKPIPGKGIETFIANYGINPGEEVIFQGCELEVPQKKEQYAEVECD